MRILLSHGSGGRLTRELIEKKLLPQFKNPILEKLDDSASLEIKGKIAFTTDSYVVKPIFFPGGDIGKLSVSGTINDLAMLGAEPLYLSLSLIIEEGLELEKLEKILTSIKETAEEAGVKIVTGDTKVVRKEEADEIFINTSGIGTIPEDVNISGSNTKPGDLIILSGYIGEHGIAVMSQREGISFSGDIKSDVAPLNSLVKDMLKASKNIHSMRDPTRGGLGTALNEIAKSSKVGIEIYEEKIPVREEVLGACEMLGIDPLYVANEGKLIATAPKEDAEKILEAMRKNPKGKNSQIIGRATEENKGKVIMITKIGSRRIIHTPAGELLPRIC